MSMVVLDEPTSFFTGVVKLMMNVDTDPRRLEPGQGVVARPRPGHTWGS
jgi:hypothetical protein